MKSIFSLCIFETCVLCAQLLIFCPLGSLSNSKCNICHKEKMRFWLTTGALKRWMKTTCDKDYKWNPPVSSPLISECVTVPQRESMFVGLWEPSQVGSSWSATSVSCGRLRAVKPRVWLMNETRAGSRARSQASLSWIPLSWLLSITQSVSIEELGPSNRLLGWDIFYWAYDWVAVDAGVWCLCTDALVERIAITQCYTAHVPLTHGCCTVNSSFCTIWPHVKDQMFPGRSRDIKWNTSKLYIRPPRSRIILIHLHFPDSRIR